MAPYRSPVLRALLFGLGIVAVVLGVIGIFLPLLPTTPFLIVAAWCFVRSSTRAHNWLMRQPVFGDMIRDWELHRAISRRIKITAITMLAVSGTFMWMMVKVLPLKVGVAVFLACVAVFIATRKERQ